MRRVADHVKDSSTTTGRRVTVIPSSDGSIVLVDDIADLYDDLPKQLLQDEAWGETFSKRHVRRSLAAILELSRDDGSDRIAAQVDTLIVEFIDYSTKQIVYVPLMGVRLRAPQRSDAWWQGARPSIRGRRAERSYD